MAGFSKQTYYCNCCGEKQEAELPFVLGNLWRCCSEQCLAEMCWREALSIMGKPYRTMDPEAQEMANAILNVPKKANN